MGVGHFLHSTTASCQSNSSLFIGEQGYFITQGLKAGLSVQLNCSAIQAEFKSTAINNDLPEGRASPASPSLKACKQTNP